MTGQLGKGRCALCGTTVAVMRNGYPRPHDERRVRRGRDGQPEIYKTTIDCAGTREPAEATAAP
jgi:hypothetical protein